MAVSSITVYMLKSGIPAIRQVGLKEILFGTQWRPTAREPRFGILYVILTSVLGTSLASLLGIPLGILTAVFLAEAAGRRMAGPVRCAVELGIFPWPFPEHLPYGILHPDIFRPGIFL